MEPLDIRSTRERLNLNQAQLASLLGVHWVTVSKWERGALAPDPYRQALLVRFKEAAEREELGDQIAGVIVGAGVAAAIFMLLKAAFDDEAKENRKWRQERSGAAGRRRTRR